MTFLNVKISWILEPLLKVQVFFYFWYESFRATEIFPQWTWTCWIKSVVCFDKSLLIGRNALRTCKKAISLLWFAITILKRNFSWRKLWVNLSVCIIMQYPLCFKIKHIEGKTLAETNKGTAWDLIPANNISRGARFLWDKDPP